jgi:predicted ArsR family transcriptional regulator
LQSTRERILSILKEHGQATVDTLSRELGLTAVTVRHHLDILRGEGLIAAPLIQRRKTPGRPQYLYALTEKAGSFFPKRYEHLASLILDEVRSRFSSAEDVDQMMQRIGERIASQASLPGRGDFEVRLAAAVEFMNGLGYMARYERRDDGDYLLHIVNCPYERVAHRDREVCTMDLAMLTRLLGVTPRRTSWTAQGDSQCVYAVHPASK